MWKTQILSSILIWIMVKPLDANSLQKSQQDQEESSNKRIVNEKISRSIFGGPFIRQHPPLVLSLGYGPIEDTFMGFRNYKQNRPMKSPLVVEHGRFPCHRPSGAFASPISYKSFNRGIRLPPHFSKSPGGRVIFPRMPVTYIVSQPQDFGYHQQESPEAHNLGLAAEPPTIELLKSDSYTLPPEVTFYHPTDYAKDYIDGGANTEDAVDELLIGEENRSHDEDDSVEMMVDGNAGVIQRGQYFQGNRKPLMFNDGRGSDYKNVYEIVSAEKLVPENLEVMVEEKMNLHATKSTAEDTGVVEVKAIDAEEPPVTEGMVEEGLDDIKNEEKQVADQKTGDCEGNVDSDDKDIEFQVEELTKKRSFKKEGNEMKSRLDVVVIGQGIC